MANEWLSQIPEDLRGEASLAQIQGKDWAEAGPILAKSYVHAQKLIGTDKIPAPQANWGDKEWGDFFNKAGRPESPDKYVFPEVKIGEKVVDPKSLEAAKAQFHKIGLSARQAKEIVDFYSNSRTTTEKETQQREEALVAEATNKLRTEWGGKFEENLELAKGVIKKFGTPELTEFLETSKLGNNPHLAQVFQKIGKLLGEDTARGGGIQQFVSGATAAKSEIDKLSGDKDFQDALNNREHVGHKQALDRWRHVFAQAYPNANE